MDKELKIVVSAFLSMLVYGTATLSGSGDFVTPIFLHSIIIFIVSGILFLMNLKQKDVWLLGVYFGVSFLGIMNDGYTMVFLTNYFSEDVLQSIYTSPIVGIGYLILLYGFIIFTESKVFMVSKNWIPYVINCSLVVGSAVVLFVFPAEIYGEIIFMTYLILGIILYNYLNQTKTKILDVIFYQFLLLFSLNVIEYF